MALGLVTGPVLGGLSLFLTFVSVVLLPFGIGIALVCALPRVLDGLAAPERARTRALLRADLPPLAPRWHRRPSRSGVRDAAGDARAWRTLAWLAGQALLGPVVFALVVGVVWGWPVFLVTLPTWLWSVDRLPLGLVTLTSGTDAAVAVVVGLLLTPVSWFLTKGAGRLLARSATRWLGPDVRARLEAQVAELERTRAIAVSAAESERRRMERDLHDGAQSRLVSLAVTLALAEEALDRDVEQSRSLLREARAAAVSANEELRALARGLAPTVLRTRGLRAALDGLAGTSQVPVAVRTERYTRGADEQVESALYFVAAEALTNAVKHAGAALLEVDLSTIPTGWVLEVRDDGSGGAVLRPGGGLAGLRDRLAPLDGTLTVDSGPGGTVVRVWVRGTP